MKYWQAGLCGVGVMAAFVGGVLGLVWVATNFLSPETTLLLALSSFVVLVGWRLGVASFSDDAQ